MTEPFVLLRDAAAPVIEKLKPTVSRENVHLLFAEFDDALAALERFGSVIEGPVGSLRAVRNSFAELFGHPNASRVFWSSAEPSEAPRREDP